MLVKDDLVGQVLTTAALELATHRPISVLGVARAPSSGGADVAIPNHIARADDHGLSLR